MSQHRVWGIVPAAGIGSRFESDRPKQYALLNDKTVLEQSVSRLLQLVDVEKIVIALHPDDAYWPRLSLANNERVEAVAGAEERFLSVFNALNTLLPHCDENDWVLVHDAARPCVRLEDLQSLLKRGRSGAGAILGVPVNDTIKAVTEDDELNAPMKKIQSSVDRRLLWVAQTPQMFRIGLLHDALRLAIKEKTLVTDEAMAMELAGHEVNIVRGSADNIKITVHSDLILAKHFLALQEPVRSE